MAILGWTLLLGVAVEKQYCEEPHRKDRHSVKKTMASRSRVQGVCNLPATIVNSLKLNLLTLNQDVSKTSFPLMNSKSNTAKKILDSLSPSPSPSKEFIQSGSVDAERSPSISMSKEQRVQSLDADPDKHKHAEIAICAIFLVPFESQTMIGIDCSRDLGPLVISSSTSLPSSFSSSLGCYPWIYGALYGLRSRRSSGSPRC